MDPKHGETTPNNAQPAVFAPATAGEVLAGTSPRPVTIYLVDESGSSACPFWVGVAGQGAQSAGNLLDQPSTAALLTSAASLGLNEQTPMMLTDTTAAALRSVLLMPLPPTSLKECGEWLEQFNEALQSWQPKTLGLYLAPEALPHEEGLDLLGRVLREIVEEHPTETIYLLTGAYGTTPVLNTALKLKTDIAAQSVNLYVFH